MRIDDIQWAYNNTTNLYEMYLYEVSGRTHRVITLEMPPMQVLNLGRRFMEVVAHDFPSRESASKITETDIENEKQAKSRELYQREIQD
jgi:hypothetical protein